MAAPNEITPAQLNRLVGTPECPMLVDVCIDEDFSDDPYLIPGSFRHPHTDIHGLVGKLNGRRAIIICQKGKKLSQGIAAWLRTENVPAEILAGGMFAWRETEGTSRVPVATIPLTDGTETLWVTRQRPKIDRIACPWLIRRFVDRDARFLFVAPEEVANVADRFGATPFDVEGVMFSHKGDKCSFDAMLDTFTLHSPALDRMADIIRAADTGDPGKCPEAAGLLALSVGLSRQFKNDTQQLEAGLLLYDALYRWARDGFDETHSWPERHV